jgi:class 3 adenylate cyclase
MAEALVRHDELIADCVERRGGRFLKSIGESTVSVFASAPDALAAMVAATRALSAEQWPEDLPIVVRFDIHTGETERRGTEYLGPAVNLAARLRGQADGGQIFLSSVTAELVAGHLPEGCDLADLGPHRLRGLGHPSRFARSRRPGSEPPLPRPSAHIAACSRPSPRTAPISSVGRQ